MANAPDVRVRLGLGVAVWLVLLGGAVALVADAGVRAGVGRTFAALADPWRSAPERERAFALPEGHGVEPGEPVFSAEQDRLAAPVGHVVAVAGREARVRFEPEAGPPDAYDLECLAPSRTLGEAVALAVPPASASRLGRLLRDRLGATFDEALRPELEARLPAFLARVDPSRDEATRLRLEALGAAVLRHLNPLLDDLTREVTRAVDKKFDLLERLGLLWKMVRGDAEGLRKELVPVAQEAAAVWWKGHAEQVLKAIGQGFSDEQAGLKEWLAGPVWDAANEELLRPIARTQRARLEAEAARLLEAAVAEVVLAPGGGLRPRFASVVRTHLLGRPAPLLLARRREAPR